MLVKLKLDVIIITCCYYFIKHNNNNVPICLVESRCRNYYQRTILKT